MVWKGNMHCLIPKTTRSRFIEILMNHTEINSLPDDGMRTVMAKIMKDLDKDGVLDPIDYRGVDDDFEDMDQRHDIEFDDKITDEEKKIALEFLEKTQFLEAVESNEDVISLESLKRIRQKRRELAKNPESLIVLTSDDYEENDLGEDEVMPNSYGRTPLHEAVGMRNLDSIKKYVSERKYLDSRDNNGNTPYQMAVQEGYMEAVKIFEKASIAV